MSFEYRVCGPLCLGCVPRQQLRTCATPTWLVASRNKPVAVFVSVLGLKLLLLCTGCHSFPNKCLNFSPLRKFQKLNTAVIKLFGFMFIMKLCEVQTRIWFGLKDICCV